MADQLNKYFEWGVDQEIFHFFGPFGLRWYSLLFLGGILTGYYIFGYMCKREGKTVELKDALLYYIVIGTVVGARLGHCLFYDPAYYFSNPLRILKVWEGGLASHGGFTGVLVAMYLFSRKYKEYSFLALADRICMTAVLAGAFIRIGNFFNSEIIGKVTQVPWAIRFVNVDHFPRHPTQLYEAFGYASISGLLFLLYLYWHPKERDGRILGVAMSVSFLFRFFIERFKVNQVSYEDQMFLNMGQLLSIPFVVVGIMLIFGLQNKLPILNKKNEAENLIARKSSRKHRASR